MSRILFRILIVICGFVPSASAGIIYEWPSMPLLQNGHTIEGRIEVAQTEFSETDPAKIVAWNFNIEGDHPAAFGSDDPAAFVYLLDFKDLFATESGLLLDQGEIGQRQVIFSDGEFEEQVTMWSFPGERFSYASSYDDGDPLRTANRWHNLFVAGPSVIGINPVISPEPSGALMLLGVMLGSCVILRTGHHKPER